MDSLHKLTEKWCCMLNFQVESQAKELCISKII